ncbi:MAG: phosphate/phosphite/phosphonate ABC transporter substrate-binding protein [Actinomycetota bacterium]
MTPRPLRAITYLAPSIPERFFRIVADHVGERLGGAELIVASRISGPRIRDDPFELGEADLGFMCAPSLVLLRQSDNPSIELVPVAPVFADERAAGHPVYFSDVVVRSDSDVARFDDLRGRTWAYNDALSLSGWHSALQRLSTMGAGSEFFASTVVAGSHLESLRLVAEKRVDGAAIDSNVLIMERKRHPSRWGRVRVVESWGPFPIQPVVVRASLPAKTKAAIAGRLRGLHEAEAVELPAGIPFERFAPVSYDDYLASPAVLEAAARLARDGLY